MDASNYRKSYQEHFNWLVGECWSLFSSGHTGKGFPFRRTAKKLFKAKATVNDKEKLYSYLQTR